MAEEAKGNCPLITSLTLDDLSQRDGLHLDPLRLGAGGEQQECAERALRHIQVTYPTVACFATHPK